MDPRRGIEALRRQIDEAQSGRPADCRSFAVVLYPLYRRSSRPTVTAVRGLQPGWAT